jgi:hypothetical protein
MTQPTSQLGQIKRSGLERYLFGFRLWNQSLNRRPPLISIVCMITASLRATAERLKPALSRNPRPQVRKLLAAETRVRMVDAALVEQPSELFVSTSGNVAVIVTPPPGLIAPCRQPDPSSDRTRRPEVVWICNGGDERRGGDRTEQRWSQDFGPVAKLWQLKKDEHSRWRHRNATLQTSRPRLPCKPYAKN